MAAEATAHFPDLDLAATPFSMGATEAGALKLHFGEAGHREVRQFAEALVAELRAIPGTVDMGHDAETRLFELAIRPDETALLLTGLDRATLGRSLAEALSGRALVELHGGTSALSVPHRRDLAPAVTVMLAALRAPFDLFSILALFLLAGTIVSNATLVLKRIGVEERRGLPGDRAIAEACAVRLRPILSGASSRTRMILASSEW